jgi:integrase
MPRTGPDFVPAYCHHKATGQARVKIGGRDFYLGAYGSQESKERYDELIGSWLSHGRELPTNGDGISVNELILGYIRHAAERYGRSVNEAGCLKDALRVLKEQCGKEPAADLGPKRLKSIRQRMIEKGWCRSYVNHQIQRLRRAIKWGVGEELIPGEVLHRLAAVDGLRHGDPGTRESEPVKPVPEASLTGALLHVAPQVKTMATLQLRTAMRPGETVIMRTKDLDMTGRVWVYRPERHKTQHHGHTREIYLGPRAQEVLRPWLRLNLDEYLFQPAEAVAWQAAQRRRERKTPLWASHLEAKAKQKRGRQRVRFADHYSTNAYALAIRRGCLKAGVPVWGPNRLRHNAATNLQKEHGIELARILLGHVTGFTTEIYLERDRTQAMEVMGNIG